ncbi:MAG TPA: MATE family efflux transporter [Stellaceae bacterium]|nr:MATE family efflux transporter [Stellaceae bacterium]
MDDLRPALATAPAPGVSGARPAMTGVKRMLDAPVLPTLLHLAAPNLVVILAQAAATFLESYFLGLLGTDILAGTALVFPVIMLMQMMSAGAVGGGISSAIARAIGAGRLDDAEALALHAVIIALVLGAITAGAVLLGGPFLYRAMGGSGATLAAALGYSNVVFAGAVALWLLNSLASILRGSGNMALPAIVLAIGAVILLGLSPALIFGIGPLPPLGVAGAGLALVLFYGVGSAVLATYLMLGRGAVQLTLRHPLQWRLFGEILRVGLLSAVNTVLVNLSIAFATSFAAGSGVSALAGYGLGLRLEYLQIPIAFGFGAALVALVGVNVGAGKYDRACRIALTGALVVGGLTEAIGVAAASFPAAWIGLFTHDPAAIASGALYLRTVAPAYGALGFGTALYFASQGAGRMGWPIAAGIVRLLIIGLGGWAVTRGAGDRLSFLCAVLAAGLVAIALINLVPWLRQLLAQRRRD